MIYKAMLSTGIEGLDSIIGGGIPEGHTVVVYGSYGTGKTTFGLHFIYEGLKNNEKSVFISLDEDEDSILESAKSFGMDLEPFNDKLEIIRLDVVMVKESLEKVTNELLNVFKRMNVRRIVIDSLSILESLFDEKERWLAISSLRDIIKQSGATAILTSESDKSGESTKYGIMEYMSDGAINLKIIRKHPLEEPVLALEVVKMRRIRHSRKPVPYMITDRGITVMEGAEIF
ncbi:KaiC domain protein, AF_0351 family [Archaeoglobus sulfaticallidus PM70-1]|uniref:KaiC domain protein, AF_0351 family n=1 Tax=Archaeoglobus sulfaticallidus PM70-1 TaxID=387631 RepID=N0BII0_9EURY|nr:KaiC domain-containing protein [Archaeoglobus sulfaticallidus]AGK62112.1 KaiC domain protein, AF_0351 family [Archaeoglobus sulfaticallidus PM70-1]